MRAPDRRSAKARPRGNRANSAVVRWLIFCFPAGLLMMWSDRCKWPRHVKSLISLGFAALLLAVLLPQTQPPERAQGGVEIVGLAPALELQGPRPDENAPQYDAYVPVYQPQNTLFVEPTPTPVPIYVYCNDGGQYYHTAKCRYAKDTTPKVTLSQAVSAGFKRCKLCKPPVAEQDG
jgi:hypothetical protein